MRLTETGQREVNQIAASYGIKALRVYMQDMALTDPQEGLTHLLASLRHAFGPGYINRSNIADTLYFDELRTAGCIEVGQEWLHDAVN